VLVTSLSAPGCGGEEEAPPRARAFPPAGLRKGGLLEPVAGYAVPPAAESGAHNGVELIFGLTAPGAGRYVAEGVTVEYESGGSPGSQSFRQRLVACATEGSVRERCPPG